MVHEECLFTEHHRQHRTMHFQSDEIVVRQFRECTSFSCPSVRHHTCLMLQGLKFSAYAAERFKFETDVAKLSQTPDFNASFTVHPVNDLETMLKLQM